MVNLFGGRGYNWAVIRAYLADAPFNGAEERLYDDGLTLSSVKCVLVESFDVENGCFRMCFKRGRNVVAVVLLLVGLSCDEHRIEKILHQHAILMLSVALFAQLPAAGTSSLSL